MHIEGWASTQALVVRWDALPPDLIADYRGGVLYLDTATWQSITPVQRQGVIDAYRGTDVRHDMAVTGRGAPSDLERACAALHAVADELWVELLDLQATLGCTDILVPAGAASAPAPARDRG